MSSDAIPSSMICPPSPGRRRPRTVASTFESAASSIESTPAPAVSAVERSTRMTPNMSAENTDSRCNYTSRRRTAATTMALLALLHGNGCSTSSNSNAVEAFVQRRTPSVSSVRTIRGTGTSTSLNFRQDDSHGSASTATAQPQSYYVPGMPMPPGGYAQPSSTSATTSTTNTDAAAEFPSAQVRSRLPTWLQTTPATPSAVSSALTTLHDAMITTYLTPSEAHTVLTAIESCAAGNQSKLGGAAEFCHILVDTMEMGVTSLVAAVRHYCECYDVREREAAQGFSGGTTLLPSGGQSIEMLERAAQAFASSSSSFAYSYGHGGTTAGATTKTTMNTANDDEADQIASDASGLKRTEAVAHTTFRTQTTRRRHHHLSSHHNIDGRTHDVVHRQDAYANMQNLLLSETRDWRSLAIRTAACLYRLRGLQAARDSGPSPTAPLTPEEVRQSRDALHIYAPLASRLGMHRLKNELEGAAFRLQYRRQYNRVMDLGREPRVIYDDNTNGNPNNPHALTVGEGMARVLRRVAENVKGVLDADPTFTEAADDVVVSARVKEPYSLWRKILKTGATRLLDVPDALALRVVLNAKKETSDEPDDVTAARERAMCYYVQSLCTKHWEPDLNKDGGRFKDYIDSPKPNGYQSLHYTASTWWGGVDWPLEIQVRTGEMHKIAEYGLAAHFDYKENAKRGGYAGESDPPIYRTYAGSRANANFHNSAPASAAPPTRLNDESYLQAVQEWHWNQIDGTAYSSSPSYQQRRFEEVQGELNSKIGPGYSPDHNEDRAQRVRARAERIAPYIESFTAAQSDLARNHVFVFLASSEQNPANGGRPSGTIVSLPSGSCILDALREGAKHFPSVDSNCFQGKAHFGVQRNGMAASSVTEMLKNGDVITLPTVCNAGEVLTP